MIVVRDEKEKSIFGSKHDHIKIYQTGLWKFSVPSENIALGGNNVHTMTKRHNLGFIPLFFPVCAGRYISIVETSITINGMGDRRLPLINTGGGFPFKGEHLTLSADSDLLYAYLYRYHGDPFASNPYTFPAQDFTVEYTIFGNVIHEIDYDDIVS